jgi:hypothetical protein
MEKLVKIGMVIGAVSVAYEIGKYYEIGIVRSLFHKLNEDGYVKYFDKDGNECTLTKVYEIVASE